MNHRPRERNGAAAIAARCRCSSSGRPTSELWIYQTEARAGGRGRARQVWPGHHLLSSGVINKEAHSVWPAERDRHDGAQR